MKTIIRILIFSAYALAVCASAQTKAKIVFFGAKASHSFGAHENSAAAELLSESVKEAFGADVECVVVKEKFPFDESFFDNVKLLVIIGDGEKRNPLAGKDEFLVKLAYKGVGIGIIHYATMPTAPDKYWAFDIACGGHYENNFSAFSFWSAKVELAKHPVTNGVSEFAINDEWYFNFMLVKGALPVLSAVPPEKIYSKEDGAHSCNKYLRDHKGEATSLAWVYEAGGRRNFAFGGWHSLTAFGNNDFRKLLVNMCAWGAGFDIPPNGVETRAKSDKEILSHSERNPQPKG